jgi:hypothetical protein
MSGTEEQIEIDLGDTPKVEETRAEEPTIEIVDENASTDTPAVEAKETKKYEKDPEQALKNLKKRLDQERMAREDAERRAQAAAGEVSETNMHLVANAIETVTRDQEILKGHLRDAMAIGDFDKAADIQAAMVSNTTNLKQLERGFEEMKNQPRQPVQPVSRNEITVDDLIDKVTPRSAEWLSKNRDALSDGRSIRIMGRAHEDAVDMGIIPESDEYFGFVESRLGIGKQDSSDYRNNDAMSDAAKPMKNRQSPPSAPVSRTPVDSSSRPGTIRLTAAEVEAAKISGISPQEYYRLKTQDRNRN